MYNSKKQYHINLSPEQVGGYVILPGDPGRVEKIAQHLENPKFVAQNREYTTYSGWLTANSLERSDKADAPTLVCVTSTGIGGPSAAIAMEELIKCGAHTFIRVGTCGGINIDVTGGDLVIATAAVRGDGTSKEYLTPDYPAAADFNVVSALKHAAEANGFRHHVGVVQSKDSFYGEMEPDSMPVSGYLNERWKCYVDAGCLASEMEAATLMCVGLARRVRVGAVLTALWNLERPKRGLSNEQCHSSDRAIQCAVDAVRMLISA